MSKPRSRLQPQQLTAHAEQTSHESTSAELAATFQQAADLMRRGAAIYAIAPDQARRQLNRAFLAHIRIDGDDCDIKLGSPWHEIGKTARYLRQTSARPSHHGQSPAHIRRQTKNPRRISAVRTHHATHDIGGAAGTLLETSRAGRARVPDQRPAR